VVSGKRGKRVLQSVFVVRGHVIEKKVCNTGGNAMRETSICRPIKRKRKWLTSCVQSDEEIALRRTPLLQNSMYFTYLCFI
jgi:hypothetical protein